MGIIAHIALAVDVGPAGSGETGAEPGRQGGGKTNNKEGDKEMLSKTSGEVVYEFDNVTKNATYRTSPLTQWRFVITFSAAQQK